MNKQKIEIEVQLADGVEIASHTHTLDLYHGVPGDSLSVNKAISFELRKAWQWPPWLKAEWIAMDENGEWYAYGSEPSVVSSHWGGEALVLLNCGAIDFTPPHCDDWRTSKRRRPAA